MLIASYCIYSLLKSKSKQNFKQKSLLAIQVTNFLAFLVPLLCCRHHRLQFQMFHWFDDAVTRSCCWFGRMIMIDCIFCDLQFSIFVTYQSSFAFFASLFSANPVFFFVDLFRTNVTVAIIYHFWCTTLSFNETIISGLFCWCRWIYGPYWSFFKWNYPIF